jgi:PAS domain S-box-containing protein
MSDVWTSQPYGKALLLALGYILLAQAGAWLYMSAVNVPYFWPAGALALAILSYSPNRQWPLLLVATAIAEMLVDRYIALPWVASIGLGLANALEAGFGAWLARRFIGQPVDMHSLKNLFRFVVFVVLLSPLLSACLGAAALFHAGLGTSYLSAWVVWWRGDALGLLLVAPVLLTLPELRTVNFKRIPLRRIAEALVLIAGLAFAATTALGSKVQVGSETASLPYTVFPFLVWAGLRFGLVAVAWATLAVAVAAVWSVERGAGPYVALANSTYDHALALQAFLAVAAVTGLVLAVAVSESTRAQASLRLSEERLRTIGDNLPVLIGYFDRDLRFRLGNKTYEDWWGKPRETRYGRTVQETDGERAWEQIQSYVQRVRAGEKVTFERDMRPSGIDKDLEVTYIPHFNQDRRVIGHYILGVDITERNLATRAMEELNDNLERRVDERTRELTTANQELEAFAYTVAHDLRAPTRHILGFSELLKHQAGRMLDEESRRLLDTIVRAATRQAKLVDDLLDYTRIGQQEVRLQPLDVAALIQEVRAQLVTEDGAAVRADWDIEDIPPLWGDRVLLRQTLTNLLQNAVKFSRDVEQPRIEVKYSEPGPDTATISICDNGAGFDPRYKDKLFHVFQRLHAEREFPGTGIGLAIVRRAVEKQSGAVWAEGQPGEGATFSFSLKQAKASL